MGMSSVSLSSDADLHSFGCTPTSPLSPVTFLGQLTPLATTAPLPAILPVPENRKGRVGDGAALRPPTLPAQPGRPGRAVSMLAEQLEHDAPGVRRSAAL